MWQLWPAQEPKYEDISVPTRFFEQALLLEVEVMSIGCGHAYSARAVAQLMDIPMLFGES